MKATKTTSPTLLPPARSPPALSLLTLLLIAAALITVASLSACSDKTVEKTPATVAQQAIAHAQARYDATRQVGNAWSKTRGLIDTATNALAAGDFSASIAAAEQAAALSEASLAQVKSEQSAWHGRLPRAP